ncbi:hypothetical protein E1193_15635 [Micromonospora sp. KC606]|uniref:hypothetical protein n=1 Tax=Micromonospora sp. KC606 TaxID=2530379 RepID=UPI00104B06A4|nr:hypothetical protein [Micromonospora sp. KC606]TDC81138.1 hypothetical protein E1193_15635 [Micromonospora sp. KC606]
MSWLPPHGPDRQAARRRTTRQQALRIRLHRRAAEALLNWLDAHDLTLDTFGQPELEHWQGDPAGGYRYVTATFIRWATPTSSPPPTLKPGAGVRPRPIAIGLLTTDQVTVADDQVSISFHRW